MIDRSTLASLVLIEIKSSSVYVVKKAEFNSDLAYAWKV